jgi:tRNA-dihydrouridine synthase A
MLTAKALLYSDHQKLLNFNAEEHPIVLQLGGSEAEEMAIAAAFAEQAGFDEVNINVGCPSDRVQSGAFGACLMKQPETVASCVRAMKRSVDLPVTVKLRTGVDEYDSYQYLKQFVATVAEAGCRTFIVHARKAWLKGLSPKQNREIPPLQYDRVYQLKKDFPLLEIIINGGIRKVDEVKHHLEHVDGVMLGREVIRNPWILVELDQQLSNKGVSCSRHSIVQQYTEYIRCQIEAGQSLHILLRPLYGLSFGLPGARKWRQQVNRLAQGKNKIIEELQAISETYFQ